MEITKTSLKQHKNRSIVILFTVLWLLCAPIILLYRLAHDSGVTKVNRMIFNDCAFKHCLTKTLESHSQKTPETTVRTRNIKLSLSEKKNC